MWLRQWTRCGSRFVGRPFLKKFITSVNAYDAACQHLSFTLDYPLSSLNLVLLYPSVPSASEAIVILHASNLVRHTTI
jgi:hypothetical protein